MHCEVDEHHQQSPSSVIRCRSSLAVVCAALLAACSNLVDAPNATLDSGVRGAQEGDGKSAMDASRPNSDGLDAATDATTPEMDAMDTNVPPDATPPMDAGPDAPIADAGADAGHDATVPLLATGCTGEVTGVSWSGAGVLTASPDHTQAGAGFGFAVGLYQDLLFVTSPFERATAEQTVAEATGALHVAQQVGTDFGPFTAIGPAGAVAGDAVIADGTERFDGPLLDTAGKYSITVADGRLVLGVSAEDGELPDSGMVYVFEQRSGAWTETQRFKAPTPQACGFFGFSVAAEGDLLVVTAPGEGVDGTPTCLSKLQRVGAAYVYRHDGAGYELEQRLPTLNSLGGDHFGWSAAVSNSEIAIGSLWERNSTRTLDAPDTYAYGSGAVYIFRKGEDWELAHYIKANTVTANAGFGASLQFTDDALIIGAPSDPACSGTVIHFVIPIEPPLDIYTGGGSVYVLDRSDFSQRQCLYGAVPSRQDGFGASIAMDGDRLIVGAFDDQSADPANPSNGNAPFSGAVYAFAPQEDDHFGCAAYVKPPPESGIEQRYGYSLSAAGGLVAVGAPHASHSGAFKAGFVELLRFSTDP